jgi:WD40-like Beta Propeller Repeat
VRQLPWRRHLNGLRQIIGIAAAVLAIVPVAALASFPGRDGVIAYAVGHSAQQGIWAVDPNTGDEGQLTSGPDEAPSFSASGNMLAFQRHLASGTTIFIARADGSNAKRLVTGSEPDFSPDGRQIVFVRAGALFVSGVLPGSHVRQLTKGRGDRTPRWSSTGAIVFQRTAVSRTRGRPPSTLQELDVIPARSRTVEQVMTSELPTNMWPDWSPDGRALAVDLCSDTYLTPPRIPSLVFHTGCLPAIWPPDGRKPILPGGYETAPPALSWGGFGSSCPRYIPEGADGTFFRTEPGGNPEVEPKSPPQISWQPLTSATLVVPTMPCAARPEPGVIHTGVSPISSGAAPTFCHRVGRRRRRKCER